MPDVAAARLRPIRDRRRLLERQQQLEEAAADVDTEQRRLAVEFARLRRELEEIRELLWPAGDGRAFEHSARPGVAGPVPVPPPIVGAVPLSGRALRDAALRVLLRGDGALRLVEIHRALHLAGYELLADDPAKQLGDALGYEARRGTVRRVARGAYEIRTLSPYRRRALERA